MNSPEPNFRRPPHPSTTYQTADTSGFAAMRFGIAVHWTERSAPILGEPLPFEEAVERFDVEAFVDRVRRSQADYLLFTITHARQMLPAPCAAIDAILPGRTTRRDLIGELATTCKTQGLKLILYYNHSCNGNDDIPWARAVGYYGPDFDAFATRLCHIVAELGTRYGDLVQAWWFDSAFSLDPSGPANTVTADLGNFRFPWHTYTAAAKAGHPGRLVTYNPCMTPSAWGFLYTHHQDYLAGEANDLIHPPTGQFFSNGLQNHRWVCIDNPDWLHSRKNTPLVPVRYSADELRQYLAHCRAAHTPLTFNVDVDQSGRISEDTIRLLASL